MKKSKKKLSRKSRAARPSPAGRQGAKKQGQPFEAKDFLTLREATGQDLDQLFRLADKMKKAPEAFYGKLKGGSLALLFQKPSMRTRVSFQVGISELGGSSVYMGPQEMPLGARESVKDVARVLSRYVDIVVARTHSHADVEDLARHAEIPVINGLSDRFHPCQTLADLFTLRERFRTLAKLNIAYVGDGNNVLNSLLYGAAKCGANVAMAMPRGYEPGEEILRDLKAISKDSGAKITLSNNPFTALKNAHAVYTDVWVSMGQEKQRDQRLRDFQPFQVNAALVNKAPKDAVILHCLPAHRGEEITDDVIESPRSVIFAQAENRLHTQKALMVMLLTRKKKK